MADAELDQSQPAQRTPWQQILFDDIFLLLMIGLVVPTLLYSIWGLMSLGEVPLFTP